MNSLLVIPSIDIKAGKTVRVVQGIPELNCTEYGNDPVEMAKIWRAENAKMLHIVDFDAIDDSKVNLPIIKKMVESVIIPVEYAGGIRSVDDAKRLLDIGVCRVVISSLVISRPDEFRRVLDTVGHNKVAVAIDVIDNEVVIRHRKIKTGIAPVALAVNLKDMGVERFIITDVNRNGMLLGPNLGLSLGIAQATQRKVTHSRGVRNKDELMDIKSLSLSGIDSVIIGRALYENRFACQKLWRVAESGIFN